MKRKRIVRTAELTVETEEEAVRESLGARFCDSAQIGTSIRAGRRTETKNDAVEERSTTPGSDAKQ